MELKALPKRTILNFRINKLYERSDAYVEVVNKQSGMIYPRKQQKIFLIFYRKV